MNKPPVSTAESSPPEIGAVIGVYSAPTGEVADNKFVAVCSGLLAVVMLVFGVEWCVAEFNNNANRTDAEWFFYFACLTIALVSIYAARLTWRISKRLRGTKILIGEHGLHFQLSGEQRTVRWTELTTVTLVSRKPWESWEARLSEELDRLPNRGYKLFGPDGWSIILNSSNVMWINRFGVELERQCLRHEIPIQIFQSNTPVDNEMPLIVRLILGS